jgi:multiple sugar transport system permease protein
VGLVSKVGRKRIGVRLTLAAIALALLLGSATMLYPMALMLAGSTKSNVDLNEKSPVPTFLFDRAMLWKKHVEGMFNESVQFMQTVYQREVPGFDSLPRPRPANQRLVRAWTSFLEQSRLPVQYYTLGYLQTPLTRSVFPRNFRTLRHELIEHYDGDIQRLNRALSTEFYDWNSLMVIPPQYLRRGQKYDDVAIDVVTRSFIERQPLADRIYFSVEGFYRMQYLRALYPTISQYNACHGTRYQQFTDIPLARSISDPAISTPAERETWETFVRTTLNLLWLRATPEACPSYRDYLKAKYDGDIGSLNRAYGADYGGFDRIELPSIPGATGLRLSDWDEFVQGWLDPVSQRRHALPVEFIRVHCLDFLFRDYLRERYSTIDRCNEQLGTSFKSFSSVIPPQEDFQIAEFDRHRLAIRIEFLTRNYVTVADQMLLHGRAAWNTFVYCALAVVGALTVNPLAAYALSRYRPRSTYKLLLLLMLTMAFPPMVTQIPVFLMMRDFGLLNTLWALILPGLANGYAIFLLKGFFDSLPKELYESASLDGAGEFRIFWQITMSLSKPILAVIALSAFTAAYSNFMFALLLCQDRGTWTLMVWIYQLQMRASEGVVLAALTLAAIPTLLVFVLCQRQIIQGIVVPVEK